MKKLLCSFLSLLFLLSLSSCAFVDRLKGDMSKLGYDENNNLLYNGNSYYMADLGFQVRSATDDEIIDLGWYSQFPIFPDMHFYAFEADNPLFIFCENSPQSPYTKGLFARSDYDLYSALYTIEDTDIEITLSSAMSKSDVERSAIQHESYRYLDIYLKDDPRIQICVSGPYKHNGSWFILDRDVFVLNDEFVLQLKAAGIIDE